MLSHTRTRTHSLTHITYATHSKTLIYLHSFQLTHKHSQTQTPTHAHTHTHTHAHSYFFAARSVVFSEDGALSALDATKGYIDCSTVDETCSTDIGKAVTSRGARFLEAPVSGSKGPAEAATLVFMCAGTESLYEEVGPFLEKMGKAKFFLGETGRAARMKLVVNMIMGSMVTGLSEGVSLASQSQLDVAMLLEVLSLGAMASPLVAVKGKNMNEHSYAPNFPLRLMQKDMRLALELADKVGCAPLTVAAAANAKFVEAKAQHGDKDMAAVHEVIARAANKS